MTVEEMRALQGSDGGSGSTDTGADDSEVPTGDEPVTDADEIEVPLEVAEADADAPEADTLVEPDVEAPKPGQKGPPKTVPYDRLSESRAELRAERAARMALEARLAEQALVVEPEPVTPLTDEQKFFRDAVAPDIAAARAETAEIRDYIREQKDREASAAFWKQNANVDEAVQDAVEADWEEAKVLAKKTGQPLNFSRYHILLLKEGEASLAVKQASRGEASKTKMAAEAQKKALTNVNRNARGVTTGNTVGRPGAKAFDKMTRKEQEEALANVVI